jgi:hypothetical protein
MMTWICLDEKARDRSLVRDGPCAWLGLRFDRDIVRAKLELRGIRLLHFFSLFHLSGFCCVIPPELHAS